MKKYKRLLLLLVISVTILIGAGAALASDMVSEIFVPKEKADDFLKEQLKINGKDTESTSINSNGINDQTFYESVYSIATEEQKQKLDKIINDDSIGLPGEWKRDVLIAVEKLSPNTPRIKLSDAENTVEKYAVSQQSTTDADLTAAFNGIAGAPDWEGGSGIHRAIYFLDDAHTEAVFVMLDGAIHVVFNENGDQTVNPIGKQQLQVDPGPSHQPDTKNAVPVPKSTPPPVPPQG